MTRFAAAVAAMVIVCASVDTAHAGAWTLPKGEGYNKFALNYFGADDTFGPSAEGFDRFSDITVNYYGEFGILDKLTVIGQLPIRRSENETLTDSADTFGIGDVDLALRYNLYNNDWVVSTQLLYKFPFLYDEGEELPLGNGQSDVEFRLQVGKSLNRFGYFGAEAGYRYRAEAPSDEFRYLAEYGFDATEKLYLRTKLDVIQAVESTDIELTPGGNPNWLPGSPATARPTAPPKSG